jgi:hypothetical protein
MANHSGPFVIVKLERHGLDEKESSKGRLLEGVARRSELLSEPLNV